MSIYITLVFVGLMMMICLKNPIISGNIKAVFLILMAKFIGFKQKVMDFFSYHMRYNKVLSN